MGIESRSVQNGAYQATIDETLNSREQKGIPGNLGECKRMPGRDASRILSNPSESEGIRENP